MHDLLLRGRVKVAFERTRAALKANWATQKHLMVITLFMALEL